jgi:murein DD-endopeptidase MepM/ murein hydrolase activator NlpD
LGDKVQKGAIIGQMQGQQDKFPGITPHYHFEIMMAKSRHKINPGPVLEALGYELIILD